MPLLLREYRLIVGQDGEVGSEITNPLQIKFDVRRSTDPQKNTMKAEIFNISPSTRARFDRADDDTVNPAILLQVKYTLDGTNRFHTVFTGRVSTAETVKQGGDLVTRIEAGDGYLPLREGRTSRTFPAGTTRRRVLDALLTDLQVPVGEIKADRLDEPFQNGVSFEGPTKLVLDQLLDPINVDWSFQDEYFVAVQRDQGSDETVLLMTPQNGLIGSPQLRKAKASRTTKAPEPDSGITIQSLLEPSIFPNRLIEVQSKNVSGIYKVVTVKHQGDYRGNRWMTVSELVEVAP